MRIFIILGSLGLACTAFSAPNYHYEASANIGFNVPHSSTGIYVVTPYETDSLIADNDHRALYYRLGIGYNWYQKSLSDPSCFVWLNRFQTDLSWFHFSEDLTGTVLQYQQGDLDNYLYRIPMNTNGIMLDGKLSLWSWEKISPYILAGFGISNNRFDYNETAKVEAGIDPDSTYNLAGRTINKTGYELGAGIDYQIGPTLSFSLDYVYNYIGYLGASDQGQYPVVSPVNFRLTSHAFLVGAHWRFGAVN